MGPSLAAAAIRFSIAVDETTVTRPGKYFNEIQLTV